VAQPPDGSISVAVPTLQSGEHSQATLRGDLVGLGEAAQRDARKDSGLR